MTAILGISAFYHDSAAALIVDGEIVAAAQEERFTRKKHDESSPFEEAAILTLDGVGEWSTTCLGTGRGNKLQLSHEIRFPHSLGLLYSAFTYYTGFRVNSGEYKLMGLAPYGQPVYQDAILLHLVDLKGDGSFHLDMSYFNYCQGSSWGVISFSRSVRGAKSAKRNDGSTSPGSLRISWPDAPVVLIGSDQFTSATRCRKSGRWVKMDLRREITPVPAARTCKWLSFT